MSWVWINHYLTSFSRLQQLKRLQKKKKQTKKDYWRRKRKHTDCINNDRYWHIFKRFARDFITAKHPFDKSLIEYSSSESGVGLKHVSKQTTTQPVCLSCRHPVYLSQRWSVFLSAGHLVCLMLCYLKRHAGKMTSNLKGQCHRNILHLFNIANYTSLFAVELYVSKEITCKWHNLCFVFNKFVFQG